MKSNNRNRKPKDRTSTSSSWFSIAAPADTAVTTDVLSLLPRAFFASRRRRSSSPTSSQSSRSSLSPTSPPTSPPLLPLSNPRRRGTSSRLSSLDTFARRRAVLLALSLAIPILAILIVTELNAQRANLTAWADELAVREASATTGRVDLESWREGWVKRRQVERAGLPTPTPGADGEIDVPESAPEVDGSDVWPVWWGNVDEVGPSPFDNLPPPLRGAKRRVLFLTDYTDYLERMNTHTYEIVDAALRHPHLIVDVWGPGWAGYDWDVPLSVNINRRANRVAAIEAGRAHDAANEARERQASTHALAGRIDIGGLLGDNADQTPYQAPSWDSFDDQCNPDVAFDFAWTMSDIYKAKDMPHVDGLDCGTLLVQQLGDCHEHRCMKEWYQQSNNITVTKYAFELNEIFNYDNIRTKFPDFQMHLFGHSPDTGNPWDFYPLPWSEKTREAAVFGFDGGFYPLRTTVTEHLRKLEKDSSLPASPISRHPHPGYTVHIPDEVRNNPLETYTLGHETYTTHRALREDFAGGMRKSQICVFDSSLERKLIRKYAQAFLSGCVVAGDLPTEHEEELEKFTIKLEPGWKIERIHWELEKYLAQPEKLHQMALDGFAYAREHLTGTSKITDMLRLVDSHRAGHRGYDQSFSFSNRCRTYWVNAQRPGWCDAQESYRGLEDRMY